MRKQRRTNCKVGNIKGRSDKRFQGITKVFNGLHKFGCIRKTKVLGK
jgi:hypothetical protein